MRSRGALLVIKLLQILTAASTGQVRIRIFFLKLKEPGAKPRVEAWVLATDLVALAAKACVYVFGAIHSIVGEPLCPLSQMNHA
jgi:hypothetical protein